MTKYLQMLLDKINRLNVVSDKGSDEKIRAGEVKEFFLEDYELRQIYAALIHSGRTIKRAVSVANNVILVCIENGRNPQNDQIVAEMEREIYKLATIQNSLHSLFWDSLKYDHTQLIGKTCGVREGWQIVSNVKRPEQNRGFSSLVIGIPKDLTEELMSELSDLFSAKKSTTFH